MRHSAGWYRHNYIRVCSINKMVQITASCSYCYSDTVKLFGKQDSVSPTHTNTAGTDFEVSWQWQYLSTSREATVTMLSSRPSGLGLDIRDTRQLESPLIKHRLFERAFPVSEIRLAIPHRNVRSRHKLRIRPVRRRESLCAFPRSVHLSMLKHPWKGERKQRQKVKKEKKGNILPNASLFLFKSS